MNGNEEKIIKMIILNGRKTLDDYSTEIGLSKRTISRIFESLQKKEIIERIGSKRDLYIGKLLNNVKWSKEKQIRKADDVF